MVVVVLVLAGVAVLGAVVVLAMGRGGELAETHPDYPRLPLGSEGRPITGPEVARMSLPRTFWGYQPHVTDEALRRLASALSERDARVDALERQLRDLRGGSRGAAHETIGALHGLEDHGLEDCGAEGRGPVPTNGEETAPNGARPLHHDDEPEDEHAGVREDTP